MPTRMEFCWTPLAALTRSVIHHLSSNFLLNYSKCDSYVGRTYLSLPHVDRSVHDVILTSINNINSVVRVWLKNILDRKFSFLPVTLGFWWTSAALHKPSSVHTCAGVTSVSSIDRIARPYVLMKSTHDCLRVDGSMLQTLSRASKILAWEIKRKMLWLAWNWPIGVTWCIHVWRSMMRSEFPWCIQKKTR
jgi:hypothetical protein